MARHIIRNIIFVCLFFIPYIYFIGNPTLPTWRIANIFFVLFGCIYFFNHSSEKLPKTFIAVAGIFTLFVIAELSYISIDGRLGTYEIFYFISLLFLFGFCVLFYVLLKTHFKQTINVLMFSSVVFVCYQLFQEFVFQTGDWRLATILNQKDIEKQVVFYKIVGRHFCTPGFLSEAGQAALWLGCLIGIITLFSHYKLYKPNGFVILFLLIGLLITLSGGTTIQVASIVTIYLLLNFNNFSVKRIAIALFLVSIIIMSLLFNDTFMYLVEYRVTSMFDGKSDRWVGAKQMIEMFLENNLIFGIAPKAARFTSSDPNTFLPILLIDHGLLGTTLFIGILIIPVALAFVYSKHKLLIVPYFFFLVHLFLAYGTYMWSYLWIIYILVLYGLEIGIPKNKPTESISTN
jgi:hypothetical protein